MSAPVLLLDAAWRVDRVIGVEHACSLIVTGAAVAASDDIAMVMHSPSITVEVPSVVARIAGVAQRSPRPPGCTPRRVRQRDRHVCQFVVGGSPCDSLGDSVDHLQPASMGGPNEWVNLVAACKRHNNTKADRTIEQMSDRFGWSLRRKPYVPTARELLIVSIGRPRESWEPFLVAA